MADINFGKTITLSQAATLIRYNPETRFMLQGEPGIGKSSLLESLAEDLGYDYAYIDVPNMDLGDIAMPVIDHATKTTKYYPNARFKIHEGKPVIIMLDEFTKGADPVKNMLHPLLEKANPRLGDIPLPTNNGQPSIVFLTGNQSTDGVGDSMKAHTRNRVVPVTVAKPTAEEWIAWGTLHDIAPEVLATVRQYPHMLASYTDGDQKDNPYIFHPNKSQQAFVSPRSLHTASNIIKARSHIDNDTLIAALSGAIGESASRDMQAFIAFADQLPTWEAILSNPATAPVPDHPGACSVVAFGAISKVNEQNMDTFMKYIERFAAEWQAVFCINLSKNPAKQRIAFRSSAFAKWVSTNQDLL
jgi:hypothetical protein